MARTEVTVEPATRPRRARRGALVAWLADSALPTYVLLAVICGVGAWLRLTALNRQSLWFDEADVVVRAQQSLGAVLHTFLQQGENGPLYNLGLHVWMQIAGSSERAVRFPSAVAGVLAIPLIYAVGARALGRRVGLLAAGLLAISPYHIWYSQEAKMYSLALLLTLASTACLIEALTRNQRWWWAGYVVATSLGFYLHVTTVLVFVAQCAFVVATWRRWPGRHRSWLIAVALLTLPYLPIALWAGKVVLGAAVMWQPKVTLWQIVQITGTKFAVNRADVVTQDRARLLYAALLVIGVVGGLLGWGGRERWSRRWTLLFAGLVALPVVGFYLLTFRQPLFNDRYLIMSLPAFLLLVALGLRVLERRAWPLALVALMLVVSYAWIPLRDVNRSSLAQKEDWRAAYHTLSDHAQADDLIVVYPGYLITTYQYYAEQFTGLRRIKATTVPSFRVEGFDAPQMADRVRQAVPGQRVWLVLSPDRAPGEDPNHEMQRWLARGGPPLFHQIFNGVDLTLYHLPPEGVNPP